jgi:hypothetical protein
MKIPDNLGIPILASARTVTVRSFKKRGRPKIRGVARPLSPNQKVSGRAYGPQRLRRASPTCGSKFEPLERLKQLVGAANLGRPKKVYSASRCSRPGTSTEFSVDASRPLPRRGSRHSRRIEPITRSAYSFCHGERGAMGSMDFEPVAWDTVMPSFSSSPWILGAPHRGLAQLIRRIRSRSSALIAGRPDRRRLAQ